MRKKKRCKIVTVREDDVTVVEVEIDQSFIERYKKETGRNRITDKGLSSFIFLSPENPSASSGWDEWRHNIICFSIDFVSFV